MESIGWATEREYDVCLGLFFCCRSDVISFLIVRNLPEERLPCILSLIRHLSLPQIIKYMKNIYLNSVDMNLQYNYMKFYVNHLQNIL